MLQTIQMKLILLCVLAERTVWGSCTDHKNAFDFFMRLVKWPKIAIKKSQNLIFKVNFQRQKSSESL